MPKGCNGPQSFHAFYLVVYEWMNDCKKKYSPCLPFAYSEAKDAENKLDCLPVNLNVK